MRINRDELASNAVDTVKTSNRGSFLKGGEKVTLPKYGVFVLRESNKDLGCVSGKCFRTDIVFEQLSTVNAIIKYGRLSDRRCFVLNFADYKEIGGQFLEGGYAQEESLCAVSNLYASQYQAKWLYDEHALRGNSFNGLYSDDAILSTSISVFKNDDCDYIYPITCDILTTAAPRAKSVKRSSSTDLSSKLFPTLAKRCNRILEIALANESETLILGAFGCGEFGNDIDSLIAIWRRLLANEYRGRFKTVVFALTNENFLSKFKESFKMDTYHYLSL